MQVASLFDHAQALDKNALTPSALSVMDAVRIAETSIVIGVTHRNETA